MVNFWILRHDRMNQKRPKVLITGANGFIGKNLVLRLDKELNWDVFTFLKSDPITKLENSLKQIDFIVHLAGENRPSDPVEFEKVNANLTKKICELIEEEFRKSSRKIGFILASSLQAEDENLYGVSKLLAEKHVINLSKAIGSPSLIYRFPGVFGKWCKPNYNSVVATFCYNLARGLPIQVKQPENLLNLVYIDDLIDQLVEKIEHGFSGQTYGVVSPSYRLTVSDLVEKIKKFNNLSDTIKIAKVGFGLERALYSTFISYLPTEKFKRKLKANGDCRGNFVEILKTEDSGQFSYFTANTGVTRGQHYHHTKTEKFLVIKGRALFQFRDLDTKKVVEIETSEKKPEIVNTIPGWVHDVTNIGDKELVVFVWANEIFEPNKPDTYKSEV